MYRMSVREVVRTHSSSMKKVSDVDNQNNCISEVKKQLDYSLVESEKKIVGLESDYLPKEIKNSCKSEHSLKEIKKSWELEYSLSEIKKRLVGVQNELEAREKKTPEYYNKTLEERESVFEDFSKLEKTSTESIGVGVYYLDEIDVDLRRVYKRMQ